MDWTDRKFQITAIVLLAAILAAVLILGFLNKDEAVDQVAYVNLEKIFAEHPAKKAAESVLDKKAAEYQQKLEKESENLSGQEQKDLLFQYRTELEEFESELLDSVILEVEEIIKKTAADKKVKFVVAEDEILYGGYNLTDQVIENINNEW